MEINKVMFQIGDMIGRKTFGLNFTAMQPYKLAGLI